MLTPFDLFAGIATSQVMQHVGGSDHLTFSVEMQHPVLAPQAHQQFLQCPPVLEWRGPGRLYNDNVQQAITAHKMQAALAVLPEQGLAAATAPLLLNQSAVVAGPP
jgi:hypothetical protein